MSKLRDQIIDEIVKSRVPASIARHPDWPVITFVTGAFTADAILAKVRDAMLRDEAVEAASDEYWDKTPNKDKSMCVPAMRLAITAALTAAGITGEDGER